MDEPLEDCEAFLVATDGSSAANYALERSIALATAADAEVHVLSVVTPTAGTMSFGVEDVTELNERMELIAEKLVSANKHNPIVSSDVRRGKPVEQILAYASENDIDFIFVGRTGSRGVIASVIGSTADDLVQESSIPVVVVPHPDTSSA